MDSNQQYNPFPGQSSMHPLHGMNPTDQAEYFLQMQKVRQEAEARQKVREEAIRDAAEVATRQIDELIEARKTGGPFYYEKDSGYVPREGDNSVALNPGGIDKIRCPDLPGTEDLIWRRMITAIAAKTGEFMGPHTIR